MTISASGNISSGTIYSQAHANLYNLINTRSNVADPNDSSGARKFVYEREPYVEGREFKGYPVIFIPVPDVSQERVVVSDVKATVEWEQNIFVWTKDSSSNALGNPQGAQAVNSISDSILSTINSNLAVLRGYGMKNFTVDSSSASMGDAEGKTVFQREFILTFKAITRTQ